MTIENCERLLEHYKQAKDNRELTEQARVNAKHAYNDMKANLEAKKNYLGKNDSKKKKSKK